MGPNDESIREQRIKRILQMYYSRDDVQEAIFKFSKNREVVPSFMMESFGKRPDSFQYKGDIFELVKKGATSLHCSQEIWQDPLKISTDLNEDQLNELRTGWDLLFDIDSKYMDYSKILAEEIVNVLKFHGIKNIGIKFSGSKGFHLIIPWKAFPKQVYDKKTSDMFPQWPRIITQYITEMTKNKIIEKITQLTKPSKYVKDFQAPKEVMPDLILVSSRHLFRMPYSLHEKTALASVVIDPGNIKKFQLMDAHPLRVKVKNFMPESEEGEAKELLVQALDWYRETHGTEEEQDEKRKKGEYKPIKLINLSDKNFPPTIQKILQGLEDGKKRALFILLNFFRAIGMEKEELEQRIDEWNKKNHVLLKQGYIKSQLSWSYRNKVVPPPNYSKDFYKGIGIPPTEEELRYKNPVNYTVKKTFQAGNKDKDSKSKKSRNKYSKK
ncbi:DNA primase small subunit domain-containing protein [Nanoarchaeota archaeon]